MEEDLGVVYPDNLIFKGKFDKIEQVENDSFKVIDYKTGKPDDHVKAIEGDAAVRDLASSECDDYYRQLVSYKLIFDKNRRSRKNGSVSIGLLQFLDKAGRL